MFASSALVPFVHAAYAIFSAEAAPTGPSRTMISSGPPTSMRAARGASGPERYMRVVPGFVGGPPMIPASTKSAPVCSMRSAMRRAVVGAIAFASTYSRL